MTSAMNHQKAKEISRHDATIADIRQRAQHWRLTDCDEETLERMRLALIQEIGQVERQLTESDEHFKLYIEHGRPLAAEQTMESINRLSNEWEKLNKHLQEVDEAILERHLRTRLVQRLGSEQRVTWLDAAVLISIVVVILLTLLEFMLPLPEALIQRIITLDTAICFFLIADFFLRLTLSEDRGWYFRRYWIDLVASIPFYEFLRFGRLIRIARFARLLRLGRAMRVLTFNFRGLNKLAQTFQLNLLKRAILIALALLFFGAISISAFEGQQEASLRQLGESVWWSFTTMVTGGFADLYNPGTPTGRFITVGLVLLGLTVTGIFTASLTSVLVEDESNRLEQNQHTLEARLNTLNQKLDLLSGQTNEGLIALETVSQALSNQTTPAGVAQVLTETMLRDYRCLQASVHLLNSAGDRLVRLAHAGLDEAAPPAEQALGEGLCGRLVARLLQHDNAAAVDLEPETAPSFAVEGVAMVCPLVAGRRVWGALHVILPDDLGRIYLYNRVPMTLAHQAAMAFYAAELAQQSSASNYASPDGVMPL